MYVSVYMPLVYGYPQRMEEGAGSSGAEIIGVCEPSDMSAGTWTWISGSNKRFLPPGHLSSQDFRFKRHETRYGGRYL